MSESKTASIQMHQLNAEARRTFCDALSAQKHILPVYVHPFYDVLIKPTVTHTSAYPEFAELLRQTITAAKHRGEISTVLKNIPGNLHREHTGENSGLNKNHQEYYRKLIGFLGSTTLRTLMVVEETRHIQHTEKIVRDAGYKGLLLFVASIENYPTPDLGVTYADVSRLVMRADTQKILLGGQRNWVRDSDPRAPINRRSPFRVRAGTQSSFRSLDGCASYFMENISKEIAKYCDLMRKEKPVIQFSQHVFPQRRGTDPNYVKPDRK